eukprot:TRINITY_DN23994_c0_g1_i1.p1 TRINITY_DN23994_c0_g1~~TRINITY_DN23994_c0_g1_i1.p1  ORF type:complete len:186 (+),score=31.48 TRINITY_DN23994_c0_g1_i1:50-607(+)
MLHQSYLLLSSLFFLACAWAQVNDPDPEIWVTLYVVAGALFNYGLLLSSSTTLQKTITAGAAATALGCTVYSAYLVQQVYHTLDFSQPLQEAAWNFLELEQGREVVGLMLLIGHQLMLPVSARALKSSKQQGTSTISYLFLAIMGIALGWAVYAWVEYQPLMNSKYNTEHCNGAFEADTVKTLVE